MRIPMLCIFALSMCAQTPDQAEPCSKPLRALPWTEGGGGELGPAIAARVGRDPIRITALIPSGLPGRGMPARAASPRTNQPGRIPAQFAPPQGRPASRSRAKP